jgi:hypothetical protein
MKGSTASWWLKLQRADHHLEEINRYIVAYEGKKVYRPQCESNPQRKEDVWTYVLEITEQPDERLPIVIGDMVHNMRSALDHILVALRPWKYRYKKGFPILTDNPWEGELTEGKRRERAGFCESISGLPGEAATAIVLLQPYLDREEGADPRRNALQVIKRLDNADKHREPIVTVPGLVNVTTLVTARGERIEQRHQPAASGYPGLVEAGTEVAHFGWVKSPPLTVTEVDVDVRGTPLVALDVGIPDGYMEARDTLAGSLGYLWEHVIPVLEQFLPEGELRTKGLRRHSTPP